MNPVIEATGLGKRYILRHEERARYATLRDVLGDAMKRLFSPSRARRTEEPFWALDDVTFQVNAGERVGIVGSNGAGKSTLLKILSRVTEPTRGRVEIEGRIASLLEVGTGFHPELTGRENIFLNAAILGMSRAEIVRKFDGIVQFAEIARFLDTPIKRYSSGMYVRLAFAVAAHLDPDILVVDEVLAVGDARFQKRCLGKMSDSADQGKTILFVSHNLVAVRSLTQRVIVLEAGKIVFDGPTEAGLARYVASVAAGETRPQAEFAGRGRHSRIHSARISQTDGRPTNEVDPAHALVLEIEITKDDAAGISVEALLFDASKAPVGIFSTAQFHDVTLPDTSGRYLVRATIALPPLASGMYSIDVMTSTDNLYPDHHVSDGITFEVHRSNPRGLAWDFRQEEGYGTVALMSEGAIDVLAVGESGAVSAGAPRSFSSSA